MTLPRFGPNVNLLARCQLQFLLFPKSRNALQNASREIIADQSPILNSNRNLVLGAFFISRKFVSQWVRFMFLREASRLCRKNPELLEKLNHFTYNIYIFIGKIMKKEALTEQLARRCSMFRNSSAYVRYAHRYHQISNKIG